MPRYLIATFFVVLAMSGCSKQTGLQSAPSDASIYRASIIDFYKHTDVDFPFPGPMLYVSRETCKGDSIGLSWGNDFDVDRELVESLKAENQSTGLVSIADLKWEFTRIVPVDVQDELDMYNPKPEHSDAKCWLRFWKPGFSKDGKRAILRIAFGPTPHGAVATFLLERTGGDWKVDRSSIAYYL